MAAVPERFEIAVDDRVLEDLQHRLARVRWPMDPGNGDWRYGTNREWLEDLVDYWRSGYDWRSHETAMNRFEHYRVVLDDVPVHYIHRRGVGPDPVPLVLTHGWPWTFWDFAETIDALADPASHGGDAADAFDVVVPSLPGYGFSVPLTRTGVTVGTTAALWVRLMQEVLGYTRFGAHGGDWGASVTAQLGHEYPEHMVGVHLSLPVLMRVSYYSGLSAEDYGPDEEGWFDKMQERMASAKSHVAVQAQDPQTLAYALNDSPVGLASWLLERRRLWSDHDGDVYDALFWDFLLTNVMLYWVTESIGSTMRFYWENFKEPNRLAHDRTPAIEAPTGIAVFPKDLVFVPRRLAEQHTNLDAVDRDAQGRPFRRRRRARSPGRGPPGLLPTPALTSRTRHGEPDRRHRPRRPRRYVGGCSADRRSTVTSASERSVSLRWVQVLTPVSSRRTQGRSSLSGMPANRWALPTAPGHSIHGRTWARAATSTTRSAWPSTVPVTEYSWTTLSTPSPSTWLSRKCTSRRCSPPGTSGGSTSRRRRRRMPCCANGAMACQEQGSSSGSKTGAGGPMGTGMFPVARIDTIMVASWAQPAQRSSRERNSVDSSATRSAGTSSKAPARCSA